MRLSLLPLLVAVVSCADPAPRSDPVADDSDRPFRVASEVERLLEALIGDEETTGFFEGQFKDLEAFGKEKAVPVLIRMLSDRSYAFQGIRRRERPERYKIVMKELAVMALGELGGKEALQALEAFAADEVQMQLSRRLPEETLVALHRLGKKKPLEDKLLETRQSAEKLLKAESVESKEDGCDQLFTLGLLLTRLKRREEAAKVYQGILDAVEIHKLVQAREHLLATVCYNLACLSALGGDRSKAIQWLDQAVRAGFTDRAWIRGDHDLDPLRGEEGYKRLLGDDKLFEK